MIFEVKVLKWQIGERDIQMLEALGEKERPLVAQQFGISVDALNSWIARVRIRKKRYLWWLKREREIERKHPHVKRTMLPTKRKAKVEEEW